MKDNNNEAPPTHDSHPQVRPVVGVSRSDPYDSPINILIVDDEPKNLSVLESVLDDPGYRLVRAESADEALLALVADEFALLILDIRMPGMTGFELAQMIKERKKTARVPIIFLSAYYYEDEHVLEGYDTGAVDYLHKPVNATILRAKVAVFAELHRKSRESAMANRALLAEVTERRRAEELLRALTHRIVQAQEAERGRVALELHDHITQLLVAILFRSQTLAGELTARDGTAKKEALNLCEMLGQAAEEVERISRNLRPGVLEHMGLLAVLRSTTSEFAERTGVPVNLASVELPERLHADIELALYRILQEALNNVEKHARAHHVDVALTMERDTVQLLISDDGVGFDSERYPVRRGGKGGLGLLSMRERANYVGGTLTVKSGRRTGTEIEVRIPLIPAITAAN